MGAVAKAAARANAVADFNKKFILSSSFSVAVNPNESAVVAGVAFGTEWFHTHFRELRTEWFQTKIKRQQYEVMMARPREFDLDHALESAMLVFWEHGFEGASLPDLLDGMGITRGSLYKAFEDKKALFLKAMELYENKHVLRALEGPEGSKKNEGNLRL